MIALVLDSRTSVTVPELWGWLGALGPTMRTRSLILNRGRRRNGSFIARKSTCKSNFKRMGCEIFWQERIYYGVLMGLSCHFEKSFPTMIQRGMALPCSPNAVAESPS